MIFPFIGETSLNIMYDQSSLIKFYIGDKNSHLIQTHFLFEINCYGICLFGNIGGSFDHRISNRLELQEGRKLIITGVDII